MRKLLLVGCNGSLGQIIYKNFNHLYDIYPIDINNNLYKLKNFRKINICDKSKILKLFKSKKFHTVINLAASYEKDLFSAKNVEVNILGFLNLLQSCIKFKAKHLVNFQSIMCYSVHNNRKYYDPRDSYTISKLAQDFYLNNCKFTKYNNIILASVLDKNITSGPIPIFINNIKNNKVCKYTNTSRDYLDSRDFVKLLKYILKKRKFGEYYAGSSIQIKTKDIVVKIKKLINKNYNLKPLLVKKNYNDKDKIILSNKKTCKVFNWKIEYNFDQTLKQIIKNYSQSDKLFSHHF